MIDKMVNSNTSEAVGIRLIQNVTDFERLREPWSELLKQNPIQGGFLTWEWLFTWWKHYHKENQLWIVTVWSSRELIGIAPLMTEKRKKYGFSSRVLSNLGTPDIDVGSFITRDGDPGIYAEIFKYLLEQQQKWDILELNEFALDDPVKSSLTTFFKNKDFFWEQKNGRHFFLSVEDGWDEYFKMLSQNTRGDVRRRIRRIEEKNKLTFRHLVGDEVTGQDIETIFAINEHGTYPEMYRTVAERAFQLELLDIMKPRGWPEIFLLYIDEQPVAYRYGFNFNCIFEDWRNGIDNRYGEYSVGKVLLMMTLEACFKRGYAGVDFLRGDEEYKTRWRTVEYPYTQIRIVSTKRLHTVATYTWIPRLKEFAKKFILRKVKQ